MAQARFATNSTANINSFPNLYPLYKSNGPNGLSYIDFERNQSRLYGMSVGAALSNPKKTGCKAEYRTRHVRLRRQDVGLLFARRRGGV